MKKEFDQKEWEKQEQRRRERERDWEGYHRIGCQRMVIGLIVLVIALIVLAFQRCGIAPATVYPNGKPEYSTEETVERDELLVPATICE